MTVFDNKRLTLAQMQLDIDGIRRGLYSDKYFDNIKTVLTATAQKGDTATGDRIVEAQVFTRHKPRTLVGGVDAALALLRYAVGYFDADGQYVETWQHLDVEAVEDGVFVQYEGDPLNVEPVIKIRGRYRDFDLLETVYLGLLTRISRIATNVYNVMEVSNGKRVLYFPARFDLPSVQAADGYAYWLAVQRYNHDYGKSTPALVSTDAQGLWWGGRGSGTIPHALIAVFQEDTAATMLAFAEHVALDVPRIVLADFNNDVVRDSLATLAAFWSRYQVAYLADDRENMRRWTLDGVRLDTSPNMVDRCLPQGSEGGVTPLLVRTVRQALDRAWESWDVPAPLHEVAQAYCKNVQIIVTGGFNRERIERFERAGVPVDSYGVGSSLMTNDKVTNTDYTMDIVRMLVNGQWVEVAKEGRRPCDNPLLKPVDLSLF
jgi:nicotinate phosphoribosyltransferase